MWTRISLKRRIYILLSALFLVTCSGSAIMAWYSESMRRMFLSLNISAELQQAQEMKTLLVNQKGLLAYYFLDSDPDWITQLHEYRADFHKKLSEVKAVAPHAPDAQAVIDQIDKTYARYSQEQDKALEAYNSGKGGALYHKNAQGYFFPLMDLCQQYTSMKINRLKMAKDVVLYKMARIQDTAMAMIVTHILLLIILAYLLVYQILNPMRALVLETSRGNKTKLTGNDVKTLSMGVRNLIEDVGQIQVELKKSRENLLQAEKMAMVGKLAAGMAHSIRNPFTSVQMRLFSMSRSLKLTGMQKEDFEVISDEINHIDTIVQNFLEFSRPPKLKMQSISPSMVVDMAIQLLCHRLDSYNVEATVYRDKILPAIEADPDQLKEVLVNLIVNACEAMPGGGKINIYEDVTPTDTGGHQVEIRISDTGTGVSPTTAERVFEPFFTTKEDGTGLGLSIVSRIIEEHGGSMNLSSVEGRGATFIIILPIKGDHP
ncbi:histidine kinase [Desulfosarcina sp. OttesenSCG-928-A07]|nr:histidine kinase [Desulfosarcina sp. OttesenSCG-928-G17]MDL2329167.1 histidine kinase [Desulfosarcina sp. OttesenSCG-928-A07]